MVHQSDTSYDILQAFFTGMVAVFPGVLLLAILLVFYFIIKKSIFKILDKKVKIIGLIFNGFALVLVLIALYTFFNWVFWPTINTAIPLIIVSLLFNRSAQKLNSTKKFTNFIYILILLVIFYAIISYFFIRLILSNL
jgi:hypothetical protein